MLFDEFAPVGEYIIIIIDVSDKRLDQILLASQLRARINSAADIDNNLLVFAVAVLVLLDEHEDIVDVDFDLLDQLDLKHNIVCDVLLVAALFVLPFVAQILISAEICLQITFGEQLFVGKIVKGEQQVAHTEQSAEQQNKIALVLFALDGRLRQRKTFLQIRHHADIAGVRLAVLVGVALVVILEAPEQHHAAGFAVAKERDGVVHTLLQLPEAHDIAKGLDLVQNAVGARKCLDQAVIFEILVHPERVERGRVKACEEHVDDDQQVDLLVLHAQREVFVIALEAVVVGAVVGVEQLVVIVDSAFEKIARALVEPGGALRVFLVEHPLGFFLVGGVAENRGNAQLFGRAFRHLPLELVVIELCHRHGSHGKDGIKAADSLLVFDFLNGAVFGGSDVCNIRQHMVDISLVAAIGLLIEVVENIPRNLFNAFWRHKGLFAVDIMYLIVVDVRLLVHRLDIIDAEGQHVFVVDRVHDRVGVQLVAEGLFRGGKMRILDMTGICREDRRTGKAEHMILLKILDDRGVHIAELAAVALVEDDDDMLIVNGMIFIFTDKGRKLLNGGDDDPRVVVFELLFEDRGGGVGVCRTLFKAVIFLHCLIVKVFSIDNKQHLVDIRHRGSEPRGFKARQRLARACCVPDISTARCGSVFLVVSRDLDPVQNPLGGGYLIRAHDHQHFLTGKNAVPRQYVEKGMLGEKRLCKVDKVGDNAVVRVRPKGGKLKAVGGFAFLFGAVRLTDGIEPRGVGIIFCIRAVGDDKNLNILKQTAAGKEALALIAVDLVERLADRNAAPLQLDMHHRKTVDKHRHVIAVVVSCALGLRYFILIDDLVPSSRRSTCTKSSCSFCAFSAMLSF